MTEAIRNDPEWNGGDYAKEPSLWLSVLPILNMISSSRTQLHATGPTRATFRDWAAMKDQDDTVPKLERASAKTLREYEALKVIQEYANSLREFMKAILRRRMN